MPIFHFIIQIFSKTIILLVKIDNFQEFLKNYQFSLIIKNRNRL